MVGRVFIYCVLYDIHFHRGKDAEMDVVTALGTLKKFIKTWNGKIGIKRTTGTGMHSGTERSRPLSIENRFA